jgi:hypothetical protein
MKLRKCDRLSALVILLGLCLGVAVVTIPRERFANSFSDGIDSLISGFQTVVGSGAPPSRPGRWVGMGEGNTQTNNWYNSTVNSIFAPAYTYTFNWDLNQTLKQTINNFPHSIFQPPAIVPFAPTPGSSAGSAQVKVWTQFIVPIVVVTPPNSNEIVASRPPAREPGREEPETSNPNSDHESQPTPVPEVQDYIAGGIVFLAMAPVLGWMHRKKLLYIPKQTEPEVMS